MITNEDNTTNNTINNNTINNNIFSSIQAQFIDIIEENKENLTSQQYINIYNKISPIPFNLSHTSDNALNTDDNTYNDAPRNIQQTICFYFAGCIFFFLEHGGGIVLYSLFGKSSYLSSLYTFNIFVLYVYWVFIIVYIIKKYIYPFLYKIYMQRNNN